MAIRSNKAFLMVATTAGSPENYSKLIDIKSTPDIGSAPNMLETTTLSDGMQTFIPGIIQLDSSGLQFTANYTKTDYNTLKSRASYDAGTSGPGHYAIWFGVSSTDQPDGHDGMFKFDGRLTPTVNGVGVDEVVEMTISIAPSTVISFA